MDPSFGHLLLISSFSKSSCQYLERARARGAGEKWEKRSPVDVKEQFREGELGHYHFKDRISIDHLVSFHFLHDSRVSHQWFLAIHHESRSWPSKSANWSPASPRHYIHSKSQSIPWVVHDNPSPCVRQHGASGNFQDNFSWSSWENGVSLPVFWLSVVQAFECGSCGN